MSTSRLQQQTSQLVFRLFGQYTVHENYRPSWLDGLELDLFVEEVALAIEIQGHQHLEYVPYFHGTYAGFQKQQKRDELKRHICETQGITLIEIHSKADLAAILERTEVRKTLNEKLDIADSKRKELERSLNREAQAIAKRLSNLHRRLERWQQRAPSEKRTCVLRSIEGLLAIESKNLLDNLEYFQPTHKPPFFNGSVDRVRCSRPFTDRPGELTR